MRIDLRLNAIVDPERAGGHQLADLARACARGGATLVQLRDKRSATRAMIEEARAIKQALATFGVPFVVNDRVEGPLIERLCRLGLVEGRRQLMDRAQLSCERVLQAVGQNLHFYPRSGPNNPICWRELHRLGPSDAAGAPDERPSHPRQPRGTRRFP